MIYDDYNLHLKLNKKDAIVDQPCPEGKEDIIYSSSLRNGEDIPSLIRPGGPSPDYDAVQRTIRDFLADMSDHLLTIVRAPGTGKTWAYINLLSELLHKNKFKVIIAAPTHEVLNGTAIRIRKFFQEHPSLKGKMVCRAKSMDLWAKSLPNTCFQMIKAIQLVTEEGGEVESDSDILDGIAFNTQMVELMRMNSPRYESSEQLKEPCSEGGTTTNSGTLFINWVLTTARAETLREIDIALITCASTRNRFFRKYFIVDYVVIEDDHADLIPAETISLLDKAFHLKVVIFVGTLLGDGDLGKIIECLDVAIPMDRPNHDDLFERYQ